VWLDQLSCTSPFGLRVLMNTSRIIQLSRGLKCARLDFSTFIILSFVIFCLANVFIIMFLSKLLYVSGLISLSHIVFIFKSLCVMVSSHCLTLCLYYSRYLFMCHGLISLSHIVFSFKPRLVTMVCTTRNAHRSRYGRATVSTRLCHTTQAPSSTATTLIAFQDVNVLLASFFTMQYVSRSPSVLANIMGSSTNLDKPSKLTAIIGMKFSKELILVHITRRLSSLYNALCYKSFILGIVLLRRGVMICVTQYGRVKHTLASKHAHVLVLQCE